MSIIRKPALPPEIVPLECKIEEPLAATLASYCRFIDSSTDHVVASALRLVFKKDYEFKKWLREQKAAPASVQTPMSGDKAARSQGTAASPKP
jgi:hypothetical protein